MMDDQESDNSIIFENELGPLSEEVLALLSPVKEMETKELASKNTQEVGEECQPKTSAEETGEGAAGSLDTPEQPMERGDFRIGEMPELDVVLDPLSAEHEEINAGIKRELKKEIQNLGYGYQYIFQLLDGVQGPLEMKREIVLHAIREAARFNCHDLTVHLESALTKLNRGLNKDNDSPDM